MLRRGYIAACGTSSPNCPHRWHKAGSLQNLGDRPLVAVTATRDALAGSLPLQDRMARLSTNSSHRLVPYTHDALVTDRIAKEASTRAIRDVVYAARFATALKKS
jgi:hypothetical protein